MDEQLTRIANALEVIAAASGAGLSAPRNPPAGGKDQGGKPDPKPAKTAATKDAKDKSKDAETDPLEGGAATKKKAYTLDDVKGMLRKVIDQDGKGVAFEILKNSGDGAANATELKPEHYEDVYVAAEQRLG